MADTRLRGHLGRLQRSAAEICVGAVLFVFVLPTIARVDVVGRKLLFYLGLVGMGSILVLLGWPSTSAPPGGMSGCW